MNKAIIGKKLGMSQIFAPDGKKDLRKQKERGREGENFLGSGVFACQKPINNI